MTGRPARHRARTVGGVAAAAAAAHGLPGVVAWRQARCRLLPTLSGVGRPGHVALSFDDGPDPGSTPYILDALDTHGWKATFFCLGSQVARAPGLATEIAERGHEIGIHGYQHRSHLRRTAPWVIEDLRRAQRLIADETGIHSRWFRPPYGAVSLSSVVAARTCGLQLVLWTTWGRDWRADATGDAVAREVERTFYPGATVLLHDSDITSSPGSWKSTLSALDILAAAWADRSLEVGPLGDHGIGRAAPGPR